MRLFLTAISLLFFVSIAEGQKNEPYNIASFELQPYYGRSVMGSRGKSIVEENIELIGGSEIGLNFYIQKTHPFRFGTGISYQQLIVSISNNTFLEGIGKKKNESTINKYKQISEFIRVPLEIQFGKFNPAKRRHNYYAFLGSGFLFHLKSQSQIDLNPAQCGEECTKIYTDIKSNYPTFLTYFDMGIGASVLLTKHDRFGIGARISQVIGLQSINNYVLNQQFGLKGQFSLSFRIP